MYLSCLAQAHPAQADSLSALAAEARRSMVCHPARPDEGREACRFCGPKDFAVGFAFRVRFTWHRLQPVCFCLAFCGVRRLPAAGRSRRRFAFAPTEPRVALTLRRAEASLSIPRSFIYARQMVPQQSDIHLHKPRTQPDLPLTFEPEPRGAGEWPPKNVPAQCVRVRCP